MAASVWSASPPSRSRAAIERTKTALVGRVVDDAHAVAQQRAAARLGRRIDRDHADGLAGPAPGRDQRRAERGFADAGRSGDADDMRRVGCAPGRVEQALRWRRCRDRAPGRRAPPPARACRPVRAELSASRLIPVLSGPPSAACAAASRAIGTR